MNHPFLNTGHNLQFKNKVSNNNNLRYADDTTLMAESEEELKSLLKEESEKVGLNLNIQKTVGNTCIPVADSF